VALYDDLNLPSFVPHPNCLKVSIMWHDPMIAETRRLRESDAAEHNHDLDAIFEDLGDQAVFHCRIVREI
jgi:hypothetical protein